MNDDVLAEQERLHNQLVKYAEDVSSLYKDLKAENELLKKANAQLEQSMFDTALLGFDLISLYDDLLGGHCRRVAHYAGLLAKAIKLDRRTVQDIQLAGVLHDIGLIGIPKKELIKMFKDKSDALVDVYHQHPIVKIRPISTSKRFRNIARIIVTHHENLDGTGFPMGLKKEKIPLEARILSVVNGYDIIKRFGAKIVSPKNIFSIMEPDVGIKYDPELFLKFKSIMMKSDPFAVTIEITINDLAQGMILAKPIVTTDGIKLLNGDMALMSDHIKSINKYLLHGAIKLPIRVYKEE